MADVEKVNQGAERLARTTSDSFKSVVDHSVAVQERNVKFLQSVAERSVREVRDQAEDNRVMASKLVERVEKQRDAFQTLVEESVDAYMDFLYTPLSYYQQGLKLVESEARGNGFPGEFPIQGYDEMNVSDISKQIEGLSVEQVRTVRDYERRHKNRETLIDQFDRKLKPANS